MTESSETILIVEDSTTLALTYQAYLRDLGPKIEIAETGAEALSKIEALSPELIFLDLKLPDMDGLDILRTIKKAGNPARVVVITAHGSVTVAVEAMREGATDFLLKPFNADRLLTTARTALELQRLAHLVEQYKGEKQLNYGSFIGESAAMQAMYRMISDAAPSRASVFIMGESGTGKELCAEQIHKASPRYDKPFVALNCAAIPANLIESEIFGHKRGAFTGAVEDREGAAVRADGGTLFLDEICEMPMDLQAKLLRFIQTGQVVPVGTNTPRDVNVRFVCATNRTPLEEVAAGRFREDLYYRLHVIPIHMPPLRDRAEDVVLIARHLMNTYASEEGKGFKDISERAANRLMAHSWPGNVRELGNVIQSAVVLNEGELLTTDMLNTLLGRAEGGPQIMHNRRKTDQPGFVASSIEAEIESGPEAILPLHETERLIIENAIKLCGGRVGQAARHLQVNPSTLYRKIKSWEDAAAE